MACILILVIVFWRIKCSIVIATCRSSLSVPKQIDLIWISRDPGLLVDFFFHRPRNSLTGCDWCKSMTNATETIVCDCRLFALLARFTEGNMKMINRNSLRRWFNVQFNSWKHDNYSRFSWLIFWHFHAFKSLIICLSTYLGLLVYWHTHLPTFLFTYLLTYILTVLLRLYHLIQFQLFVLFYVAYL